MAPVCVASRLSLLVWFAFLLYVLCLALSVLVHNCQSFPDLQHVIGSLGTFEYGGQKTLPQLLSEVPFHLLLWTPALNTGAKHPPTPPPHVSGQTSHLNELIQMT